MCLRIMIYCLEPLNLLMLMIICNSNISPVLNHSEMYSDNSVGVILGCLLSRCFSSLVYICFYKHRYNMHYLLNKTMQIVCLFIFHLRFENHIYTLLMIITMIVEFGADCVYIYCKEQRYGYFDSRLNYNNYLLRICTSYFALIIFSIYSLEFSADIPRIGVLFSILVCSLIHLVCVLKDSIYSLLTTNMLSALWGVCSFNILYQLVLSLIYHIE